MKNALQRHSTTLDWIVVRQGVCCHPISFLLTAGVQCTRQSILAKRMRSFCSIPTQWSFFLCFTCARVLFPDPCWAKFVEYSNKSRIIEVHHTPQPDTKLYKTIDQNSSLYIPYEHDMLLIFLCLPCSDEFSKRRWATAMKYYRSCEPWQQCSTTTMHKTYYVLSKWHAVATVGYMNEVLQLLSGHSESLR